MKLLRETTQTARKIYRCDASQYIQEWSDMSIFTISELRLIVLAKRQGFAIRPGQTYVKQVGVDETARQIIIYRAIPTMDMLCNKYDLFPGD